MRFKNETHKRRFIKEIQKMDKSNDTQMAVAFLLTANRTLWKICKTNFMLNNRILVHRIRLARSTEEVYLLFCAAKDIALGTAHLTMNDLVDETVVSSEMWQLIFTALEIKRYGVGIVFPKQKENK